MSQKPQESTSSVFPDEIRDEIRKHVGALVTPQKPAKGTPDDVQDYIDLLIPRGGESPKCISVTLEEYLSRLAILYRKILGVQHRKEQWDKTVASHSDRFGQLLDEWPTTNYVEGPKIKSSFSLRSVRLENEFEVLLFSVCGTLSMLTRVVAAFLSGNEDLHSHEKLAKVLLRRTGWSRLAEIVGKARVEWADDVFARRDDASHYIALTAPSVFHGKDKESPSAIQAAIPRDPERFVSPWLDDVPAIGGTIIMSSSITEDDGTVISETHGIYDMDGELLVKRTSPRPLLPVMDGSAYVNETMEHLGRHIIDVLRKLHEKVCDCAAQESGV